jgi:hypothetical protein
MLVSDHLRPAALKAGVDLKPGQRFGFHNLRQSLSSLPITARKPTWAQRRIGSTAGTPGPRLTCTRNRLWSSELRAEESVLMDSNGEGGWAVGVEVWSRRLLVTVSPSINCCIVIKTQIALQLTNVHLHSESKATDNQCRHVESTVGAIVKQI